MNKSNTLRVNFIIISAWLIFLFSPFSLLAQISEGGTPPSFAYSNTLKSTTESVNIPITFSVEDMKTVDAWQVSQGAPLKVSTLIAVNLTMDNSGQWSTLPSGEKIWQLNIHAPDAIAINLYYKAFFIPEGGKLFIYNADHTQIIGAYTSKTNPKGGVFATEFVEGDNIILEYVSSSSPDSPKISIAEIGYGYNHLYIGNTPKATGEGSSGSCNVNINCSEGDSWQSQKKGVCQLVMKNGNSTYICSGSLLNNVKEDFKPYILSAYHCMAPNDVPTSASDMSQWIFYFHYEETGCDNLSDATLNRKTMIGCTKKASIPIEGGSDGLLLLINDAIPDNYNVYYNGWSISPTGATSGVGIHHPAGDAMKISTFTSQATSYTWAGSDSSAGMKNAHWKVIFAQTTNGQGVTEGGSSGSALFNQDKLVVGTLTGGNSSCTELSGLNLYGKLYYHWNKSSTLTDTTRMDIYLDPANTGATSLAGRYRSEPKPVPQNLTVDYDTQKVVMKWSAPSSSTGLTGYKVYRNNVLQTTTTDITWTDNTPPSGQQYYSVTALYSDNIESEAVGKTVTVITYYPPSNMNVTLSGLNVNVSWVAPSSATGLSGYKVFRNDTLITTTTSTTYRDTNPSEGHHFYSVLSTYSNGGESGAIGKGLYVYGFKSPESLNIVQSGHTVNLSWKAPVYEQTIQWGTTKYSWKIKESLGSDFYFGQAWSASEITPLYKKQIVAVNFIPTASPCTYSVFIMQGTRKYTQNIPTVALNSMNTVLLTTPFVIDKTSTLRVTIKAVGYNNTDYPAACDEGPAVSMKGNLFSKNTTTWSSLSSENNYNFIIQAVVNSTEGTLTTSDTLEPVSETEPQEVATGSITEARVDQELRSTSYEVMSYTPVSFPTVSGYNVYRNGSKLNATAVSGLTYQDMIDSKGDYLFGVSTLFDSSESGITTKSVNILFTGLELLPSEAVKVYPSPFKDRLYINDIDLIKKVEIIAEDGRLVLSVNRPGNVVYTSGLAPGNYFIRLHHEKGTTVIRSIKR